MHLLYIDKVQGCQRYTGYTLKDTTPVTSCCALRDSIFAHLFLTVYQVNQSPEYWPPPEINIKSEPESSETPETRSPDSTEPEMSPEVPEPPEPKSSPEPEAFLSSKSPEAPEPKSPEPEMSPEIWRVSMGVRRSSSSCSRQG